MKRKSIIIASTLALGTLLPVLAGCNAKNQSVVQAKVDVVIEGVDASLINVTYDKKSVKPNTMLNFTVAALDPSVKIVEVKFNGAKITETNGVYSGLVLTGNNQINIKASKEGESGSTLVTEIEGVSTGDIEVEALNEIAPGEDFKFQLNLAKDIVVHEIYFNNNPVTINMSHVYKVLARKGANTLKIVATNEGSIKPTINKDVVLIVSDGTEVELTKKGEVYESAPISIENTERFGIYHKVDGEYKVYSLISHINPLTTFAAINNDPVKTGLYRDLNLTLSGGSTYKFIFNPNALLPISVIRTNVDTLPTTPDELKYLLDNVNSNIGKSYNLRSDINSVTTDVLTITPSTFKKYEETSTFTRFNDNSAITTLKVTDYSEKDQTQKDKLVYNKLDNNILYTVDKLKDYFQPDNNFSDFSSRLNVVDKYGEDTKYQISKDEAAFNLANPTRNAGSIGALLAPTYQSFTSDEDASKITSTANDDGFVTTISSRRIIKDTSTSASTKAHLTNGNVTFTKDGKLVSTDVKTYEFDSDKFDFTTLALKEGVKLTDGNLVRKIITNISYGLDNLAEPTEEASTAISKYFISEINNVVLKSKKIDRVGNNLLPLTFIDFEEQDYQNTMTFEYLPETALNKSEINVIGTDNKTVIDKFPGSRYYRTNHLIDKTEASCNITVGSAVDGKVKTVVPVTVIDDVILEHLFINDPFNPTLSYDYKDKRLDGTNNSRSLALGSTYSIIIGGSPAAANLSKLMPKVSGTLLDAVPASVKNSIVTKSYDAQTGNYTLNINLSREILDVDTLSKPSTKYTLQVVLNDGDKFNGEIDDKGLFKFDIYEEVTKETFDGTWTVSAKLVSGSTIVSTLTFDSVSNKMTVDVDGILDIAEIKVKPEVKSYEMRPGTFGLKVSCGVLGATESNSGSHSFDFDMIYFNPISRQLGINFAYTYWGGAESERVDIIGIDEENPEWAIKKAE